MITKQITDILRMRADDDYGYALGKKDETRDRIMKRMKMSTADYLAINMLLPKL